MTASILDALWRVHNDPSGGHEAALAEVELSFEDGQRLQLALLERWLNDGEELGGWKIGMTSGANRNAMGDGVRPFGFILRSRIQRSGDTVPLAPLHNGQVENELCIVIAEPLGAGADRAAARAAAAGVAPGFEINQKRLPPGTGAGLRVADDLSNWGIVAGETVAAPDDATLAGMIVTLHGADGPIESVASDGHIDDHFESLAILARTLAAHGHTLQPGQHVITGAYGKAAFAPGTYTGVFEPGIGSVEVTLA